MFYTIVWDYNVSRFFFGTNKISQTYMSLETFVEFDPKFEFLTSIISFPPPPPPPPEVPPCIFAIYELSNQSWKCFRKANALPLETNGEQSSETDLGKVGTICGVWSTGCHYDYSSECQFPSLREIKKRNHELSKIEFFKQYYM